MSAVVKRAMLPTILVACGLLLAGIATAGVVTRSYDFPRPVVKLVDGYHTVTMDGVWSFGAPGEPVLPVASARLLLPPGERALSAQVIPGDPVVLGTGFLVEAGQPQYPLSFTGPIQEIAPDYAASGRASFPGRLSDEPLFGLLRGHGIASVALHPVEFRPADGALIWYPHMTVEVVTADDPSVMDATRTGIRRDDETVARVLELVDNPGADGAYALVRRGPATSRTLDPSLGYRYLIITTESWDDYFTTFATFQTQRGFKAGIFLKSWIVANYAGVDEAAKIRAFIIDAYNTWDVDYALLVGDAGDANGIPHRGLRADGYGEIDNNIPADIYYGALNGTWNTDNDSYWGEVGEEDFYPEVAVGRACVSDATQAQNFVTKTMRYLNSPVVAESDDALMVGELLWSSPLTYGDTYKDQIRYGSNADGYTTVGFLPGTMNVGYLYDSYGTWSKTTLIGLMEGGKNIINHLGHCNVQYALKMYNTDIPQFDNDGTTHSLNFVYSQGCYCGSMDNRDPDGAYIGDCFAEAFTCDDDGAVAVIMNSRYGWGDPGGTNGSSQYFDRQYFDAFFNEHLWAIGTANDDSKTDNVWSVNYGANRWCYYQLNLFGDPAMHLWTGVPTALSVSHPSAIIVGQPEMQVSVLASGQGAVAGARATVWSDDYSVYDTGVTDGSGLVTLYPNPTSPGTVHIKVWAHDHLVYNADINVAPATGPFVVLDAYTIDDDASGGSNGNGDGIVNAGETVQLRPTLRNVGSVTAVAVTGGLSSGSGHVTITDDEDSYGSIPPATTAPCVDDYVFVVASSAPNGAVLPFTLDIAEGGALEGERASRHDLATLRRGDWQSGLNLTVAAPVLAYASHTADDPLYSGNGNGCLEAGETVLISVSLRNTGAAEATNVVATLSSADPHVRINEAERGVASIAPGATAALDATYSITLLPDCPGFHEVDFALAIAGDWGYSASAGFAIMSSGGDFADAVESGEGEWTHSNVTGGFADQWHVETYRSHSTTHSWKFGGEGMGDYADSADGGLVMRPLCLGAGAQLTFWDWLEAEQETSTQGWDGALVEISTDGGTTWAGIAPVGGYSHTKFPNPANPLPDGTPFWSGAHGWRLETFDLSAYAGETVQIRFRFASDGYVVYEGWYVDDVNVTSTPTALVADGGLELGLEQNRPNPFNPVTTISYTLPGAADVRVEVYNAAGKLVRILVDGPQEAGLRSAVWDGTNDSGQRVSSGVYMYRLEANGRVLDKRMVLLK
jgi:hypothetical protein